MAKIDASSLQVPYQEPIASKSGRLTQVWEDFFRLMRDILDPLGVEKSFALVNHQASASDVDGLSFKLENTSYAVVDYLIQRVTTSTGATELVEGGSFFIIYKPTSAAWALSGGPSTAGITLSITASGQVQYTSSNITGTASISKITWRARTLAAKHSSYSVMGR